MDVVLGLQGGNLMLVSKTKGSAIIILIIIFFQCSGLTLDTVSLLPVHRSFQLSRHFFSSHLFVYRHPGSVVVRWAA